MKKVLILFIILLTGCSVKMDLNITQQNIEEIIDITTTKEKVEYMEQNQDETVEWFTNLERGFEFYNKELIYKSNDEITKRYLYTYDYNNYDILTLANNCYETISLERRQQIIINTSDEFLCFEHYNELEEVTVRIKSVYKVEEHNADEIQGEYYVWKINKENYETKPINIKMTNEFAKESKTGNYFLIFLGVSILIAIILVIRKIKKVNEY